MLDTFVLAFGSARGFLWLGAVVPLLVRPLCWSTLPLRQLRRLRTDWLTRTSDSRKNPLQRVPASSTPCSRTFLG
jgi:hypothetical protein